MWQQTLTAVLFANLLSLGVSGITNEGNTRFETDSARVIALLDSAYAYEIARPESAIRIYRLAAALAKNTGYHTGYGRALQYTGIVYHDQSRFDSAIKYYDSAIAVFGKIPYPSGIASTYVNLGNICKYKAEYGKSVDYYLKGIRLFEQVQDTPRIIYAYTNIGTVLSNVEQYERGRDYIERSLAMSYQTGDSLSITDGLSNLAFIDFADGDTTEAIRKYEEARKIAGLIGDRYMLYLSNHSLSNIYASKGDVATAYKLALAAKAYARQLNNPAYIANSLAQTGHLLLMLNREDSAAFYLNRAIDLAEKNDLQESLLSAYLWKSELMEKQERYREALAWRHRYENLGKKVEQDRQKRMAAGLEIAFATEKKDLLIAEKSLKIERNEALLAKQNYFIVALAGALLSALVVFLLVRRSLRQKKIIAEKDAALQLDKVEKLKKEQQVVAMRSMMEGEEKERIRLAKDLHDGLGGLLSSVKGRLSQLAGNIPGLKKSADFRKAIELVDQTSKEARKISHNLMPGTLMKFGLVDALRDYCQNLSGNNGLSIEFQEYGVKGCLRGNREIMVFRIVQELLQNIVRHAHATEAIVQLSKTGQTIHLTVEDNGRGFDTSVNRDGLGLSSIRSRVDYLQGEMSILSDPGKGTSTYIEFRL